MKKRVVNFVMAACVAATVFAGCGAADKAANTVGIGKDYPEKLTFTYVTAPLNIPSIVEKEKEIFKDAFSDMGIAVEYAELTSGADQTQALASGDVQVLYAVGASSVILSAAAGADIKVLNMYSRSPKAFCLYAASDAITSPEDLRGKTIAGPVGTNLHELLAAYLASEDMTMEDVNFVNMTIPDTKAALDGGSIDAALLAGTAAYQAKQEGYQLITDGEGLIDAGIAVAVTEEFYEKHPKIIEILTQVQKSISDYVAENEEAVYALVAKKLDLELEAVKEMAEYYDFSTEVTEADIQGFQKTADFMLETDMIENAMDVQTLF